MSFANQALAVKLISEKGDTLENQVYKVPPEVDSNPVKVKFMGIGIETLTEQDVNTSIPGLWEHDAVAD